MNKKYQPPEMPNFPATVEELYGALAPYYHAQRPLDLFFEFFIVDTIGLLPQATHDSIRQLIAQHPVFFASTGGDWRLGVRQDLHLSDTIEIAILDLWYINSRKAVEDGWSYHPWHFARDFFTNYYADDSLVDMWEGDMLEQAKARIRAAQKGA